MKAKTLLTVILSIVLVSCVPLSISTPTEIPIPTASITLTPVPPTPTPTPEFQRLSPASIMRILPTDVTIQASLFARESCIRLDIDTSGFQWSPGSPQDSRLVLEVAFLDGDTGAPLIAEEVLRGGGGGGGGPAPVTMVDSLTYDIKSSLPARVTVMVTFHEALGITQPVRFDLEPTARPNMYCPQLPLTTPEG